MVCSVVSVAHVSPEALMCVAGAAFLERHAQISWQPQHFGAHRVDFVAGAAVAGTGTALWSATRR